VHVALSLVELVSCLMFNFSKVLCLTYGNIELYTILLDSYKSLCVSVRAADKVGQFSGQLLGAR